MQQNMLFLGRIKRGPLEIQVANDHAVETLIPSFIPRLFAKRIIVIIKLTSLLFTSLERQPYYRHATT